MLDTIINAKRMAGGHVSEVAGFGARTSASGWRSKEITVISIPAEAHSRHVIRNACLHFTARA